MRTSRCGVKSYSLWMLIKSQIWTGKWNTCEPPQLFRGFCLKTQSSPVVLKMLVIQTEGHLRGKEDFKNLWAHILSQIISWNCPRSLVPPVLPALVLTLMEVSQTCDNRHPNACSAWVTSIVLERLGWSSSGLNWGGDESPLLKRQWWNKLTPQAEKKEVHCISAKGFSPLLSVDDGYWCLWKEEH